jgi:hypothetical protein
MTDRVEIKLDQVLPLINENNCIAIAYPQELIEQFGFSNPSIAWVYVEKFSDMYTLRGFNWLLENREQERILYGEYLPPLREMWKNPTEGFGNFPEFLHKASNRGARFYLLAKIVDEYDDLNDF